MEALTSPLYVDTRSLYAQFIEEVHGLGCLEYNWGYATYELGPDYVYIVDIYVVPAERANKKGIQLMNEIGEIGKAAGKTRMFGSVAVKSKEPLKNYQMLVHLGFQDSHQDNETVYLVRAI